MDDVAEDFGRDGFLYLGVLGDETRRAVLEEVVQARVFLDEMLLRLRQQTLDGREVLEGS